MRLSRLSNSQLRRLLRDGEVRFSDNDKHVFDAIRLYLSQYLERLKGLKDEYSYHIYTEIARYGLDPKYKKNLNAELKDIFSESRRLENSIKQVKDKIIMTLNQIK